MAYTPKTWQCDDTITADELNRMEQGIAEASSGGGTPLIVNISRDENAGTDTLDHTWQEIHDAFEAGRTVYLHDEYGYYVCSIVMDPDRTPPIYMVLKVSSITQGSVLGDLFTTRSLTDYPSYEWGD